MARCSIVTPSYIGDLALARDLCASVDKFVSADIPHILVVPSRDLRSFSDLESGRRRVISIESVLPWYFYRIPAPTRIVIPGILDRRLREAWLSRAGVLSGWLVQQIVKLSTPQFCNTDIIVMIDSDIRIVRPINKNTFDVDGKTRLPGRKITDPSDAQKTWHKSAARILALPEKEHFGVDFIGNMISWRRENVLLLQQHIERVSGGPWQLAIARCREVSEYILYGVFCQEVLGEKSGHVFVDTDFTHTYWFSDWRRGTPFDKFVEGFSDDKVAVLIQSTIPVALGERRRVLDAICKRIV